MLVHGDGSPLCAVSGVTLPGVHLLHRHTPVSGHVLYRAATLRDDAHPTGDGLGRDGVVTRHHDHLKQPTVCLSQVMLISTLSLTPSLSCLSVHLCVCLSLSLCVSVCLSVCLSRSSFPFLSYPSLSFFLYISSLPLPLLPPPLTLSSLNCLSPHGHTCLYINRCYLFCFSSGAGVYAASWFNLQSIKYIFLRT